VVLCTGLRNDGHDRLFQETLFGMNMDEFYNENY
jgi:hypothetical protein